ISYRVGHLDDMGPGFFPVWIGVLLAATGILTILGAWRNTRRAASTRTPSNLHGNVGVASAPDGRGAACVIASLIVFHLMIEQTGLIPATVATVSIAALGDRTNTPVRILGLATIMSVVAWTVFWWALNVQVPLFYA
ncbi:MAG: tripartite tricarboxylate transporter TctB family protein, partial [Gluconacetobacter liquefaciens]